MLMGVVESVMPRDVHNVALRDEEANRVRSSRRVTCLPTLTIGDGPRAIWAALRKSGAVLLKDAATTPAAFEAVTDQFAASFRIHQDPTRQRYSDDDTTQGVTGGTEAIGLHAERAYLPGRPELLFFGCLTPPVSGGATTLCDGAAVVEALPPEEAQRLAVMTLLWRTSMQLRMWQRLWNTDDPGAAAALLNETIDRYGERAQTQHWFEADTLHIDYRTPGLNAGWISGLKAFANYLLLAELEPDGPRATQIDGRRVPKNLLDRLAETADALTIDIPWQRGDVAIIDNTRCMHGRRAFAGGARQILVRMGDAGQQLRATSQSMAKQ
ncbi:MAG: hypothetical protein GEU99_06025 [Luteitalea sp.]|nr:hypothetical protein [Luteitalea sp.]